MKFLVILAGAVALTSCLSLGDNKKVRQYMLKNTSDNGTTDQHEHGDQSDSNWWKTAIVYQINVKSFRDTNGDGVGDLHGVIEKLPHLKDAGVTAILLTPIFKSGGLDFGYDVIDYKDIDAQYGGMKAFHKLMNETQTMGIRVILTMVPNHTSKKSEWFVKSEKNDAKYKNYYVWAEGYGTDPPNNWLSHYGGSAWTYSTIRKAWYLHQFADGEPDLNFNEPAVVNEMKDIFTFWLGHGVNGFFFDNVETLVEDVGPFDEPKALDTDAQPHEYGYLNHIYTTDQDATYEVVYTIRSIFDSFNNNASNPSLPRLMITGADSPLNKIVPYLGSPKREDRPGAHITLNYHLATDIPENFTSAHVANAIHQWYSVVPRHHVSNWMLGDHKHHRLATRLGSHNVDAFNMLTAILPGVQIIYNGEELGMEDGQVSCAQGRDPPEKNCGTYNQTSRDFERTPYQWDDTMNAGFSSANKTWLPVANNYKWINFATEKNSSSDTHLKVFWSALALRQNLTNTSNDSLTVVELSENVVQVIRMTDDAEYHLLFNTGFVEETLSIFTFRQKDYWVAVRSSNSSHEVGDHVNHEITLQPHECLILQSQLSSSASYLFRPVALLLFVSFGIIKLL